MNGTGKKIGILGIGNLLLSDEGFGVHVVNYLDENYNFPEQVLVQDGGTAGIYMAPLLEKCDPVLVIDAVNLDDEPGSFHHFTLDQIQTGNINMRMSPHQLGLLEVLDICRLRDNAPEHMEFFCLVPASLETGLQLSDKARAKVASIADMVINSCNKYLGAKSITRKSHA